MDINFPFDAASTPAQVMERMEGLYQTTLAETQELLDPAQLDYAAKLVMRAGTVDIYTGSHNLYPAGMFHDRLLSAGKRATCYGGIEAQVRTALTSGPDHVAIVISYSGLAPNFKEILPILSSRHVPVIVIGTPYCARIRTASRSLPATSPCSTCSIRSIAATLPKISPAAPSSSSDCFPTPACPGLSSDERGFSDTNLTSVDDLPL